MERECPCKKDCSLRTSDCHARCQSYIDWKREYEEARKQQKMKNQYPNSPGRWIKTAQGYWRYKKN